MAYDTWRNISKHVPIHLGSTFTWTPQGGLAEISGLGPLPWARVFPDAHDEGFIVKSHKTGRRVLWVFFTLVDTVRSPEGDIEKWVFRSNWHDTMITVFND